MEIFLYYRVFQILDDKEEDQDETLRVEVNKSSDKTFELQTEKPVEGGKVLEASTATTNLRRKDLDGCMEFHKLETQSSLPESIIVSSEQHEKLSRNLSPLTVMGMDLDEKEGNSNQKGT